jgi:hypothetical protein
MDDPRLGRKKGNASRRKCTLKNDVEWWMYLPFFLMRFHVFIIGT